MIDHQYAYAMLSLQGQLRERQISLEQNKASRALITKRLEQAFFSIIQHIAPSVVLEIGAHEADFSKRVITALPACRVLALEANPSVYARYAPELASTGVNYLNLAAAAAPGYVEFSVPMKSDTPGGELREIPKMGSLLTDPGAKGVIVHRVKAEALDNVLGTDSRLPNAMWLDVEGAIGVVLRGASECLNHCQILYAEVEPTARWDNQLLDTDVVKLLFGYGLVPLARDVQRRGWQYNCLFIRSNLLADGDVMKLMRKFFST
jgi:FkbM family methyltransferase